MIGNRNILLISVIIFVITYMFWGVIKEVTGISVFYIGNAMAIVLLSYLIFKNIEQHKWVSFTLLIYAINNLVDEVFDLNHYITYWEILIGISAPVIAYLLHERK